MTNNDTEEKAVLHAIKRGDFNDCYLIYNRKSTDEPNSQKNSISFQREENVRFAKRLGLKLADVSLSRLCNQGIISEKHSGFKESDELHISDQGFIQYEIERPKFLRMLKFLNDHRFKGVIFLCWDRASRNRGDDTVLRKLMSKGVDVRFVDAVYEQTSSGELQMDITGAFAQHHSRVTSEKVRRTTMTKRAEG